MPSKNNIQKSQAPRGFQFKSGQSETPGEARKIAESRIVDMTRIYSPSPRAGFAEGTVSGAPSIVEQARALKDDPQLIYQFVHDNIEWEPGWGVQKGALGCLLDGMGNAFDQSMLMVELLREAGFTAKYVMGTIELTEAELNDWFGTSGIWASYNYCGNENIPRQSPVWNGSNWDMIMSHVWVECIINSTTYVFDPSRKDYTRVSALSNLDTKIGYTAGTFLSNAKSGATVTTDYAQNINTSNIQDDLKDMTANLISWIETNDPDATVEDILGGQRIVPATIPLLQTSLPYQATGDTPTVWTGDVPLNYKTTLRVRYPDVTPGTYSIDETFTSDQLAGKRLTLFFDATRHPVLRLDGVTIATGNQQGVGTWNSILLTVTHNAYSVTWYDQEWWQSFIWEGQYYLIGNAWGNLGPGQADLHRERIGANIAAGGSETDEDVLGEKLALTFSLWASQNSRVCDLTNRLTNCHTMYNHQVGIVSFNAGDLLGADLGGVSGSSTNLDNDVTQTPINDTVLAMHGVAIEAAVMMQMTGSGTGASATTVIDKANSDGDKIYKGTSSNWNTGSNISSTLVSNGYNSTDMSNLYNWYIQWGYSVLISEDPTQTIDDWQGWGYFAYPNSGAFGIINGGLKGTEKKGKPDEKDGDEKDGDEKGDPIDILSGSYNYRSTDITLGSHEYPYKLSFERIYKSKNKSKSGPMGFGWTHNLVGKAKVISDGLLSLGRESAVHGAASIVELFVTVDLVSDTSRPVDKLVVLTLSDKWWIDQISFNVVSIELGETQRNYLIQPDGSFTAPISFPSVLSETSGEYSMKTPDGVEHSFDSSGALETIEFPFGVTLTYTYTSGKLTSLSNGLGRTLTITYSGDRISSVSDGNGRSVSYQYDTDGNLIEFTDPMAEDTTYEYDSIGRMTKFFKPANPTTAVITNTYDTLGRVKQQANGRNQIWKYFIAGSRASEEDPLGNEYTWYFNEFGSITLEIDPLGNEKSLTYDGRNRLIEEKLPEGNKTQFTYDSNNNILTKTMVPKPSSGLSNIVETMTYDTNFTAKVKTVEDGNTNVTTYTYDSTKGTLSKIERPQIGGQTPTVNYTYNSRGQLLTRVDETGVKTECQYDSSTEKRLKTIYDPGTSPHLNLEYSFDYDAVGNITGVTDPNGNKVAFEFDNSRRVTKRTEPTPLSYQTKYSYDKNGNTLKVERQTGGTPAWQENSYTYSVTDKALTLKDPANNVTTRTYNSKDNLATIVDAENRTFEYTWDELDRLKQVEDPTNTNSDTRTYSSNGKIASIEDANGNTTDYTYDGHDRLDKIEFADNTFEQRKTYDSNGNLLTFVNRAGDEITATFDDMNRCISKSPDNQPTITIKYDLAGRLIEVSKPVVSGDPSSGAIKLFYDDAGRYYKEEYPDGKTVTHERDGADSIVKTTWPDGYYVNKTFDEMNRLKEIKLNGSSTPACEFTYDNLSRKTGITFANGTSASFTNELNEDTTKIVHTFSGSSLTIDYTFNKVHEIESQTVSDAAFMWHPSAGGTSSYGTASNVNEYPSVGGNTFTYNDNGCITSDSVWTFAYDTENHLTSATKTGVSVGFLYDPFHRQAQKTVGSSKTRFIYDQWKRVADYDGVSGNLLNRYVYGSDLDEVLVQISSSGTLTFYHSDNVGSISGVSNSSGTNTDKNKFGPFGEVGTVSGTDFGFTGQRFDSESNLFYFKTRYYSPDTGRFLQPDQLGYEAGDLNLFTYVGNSPLNRIDPMGQMASGVGNATSQSIPNPMSAAAAVAGTANGNPPEPTKNCPTPPPTAKSVCEKCDPPPPPPPTESEGCSKPKT